MVEIKIVHVWELFRFTFYVMIKNFPLYPFLHHLELHVNTRYQQNADSDNLNGQNQNLTKINNNNKNITTARIYVYVLSFEYIQQYLTRIEKEVIDYKIHMLAFKC